MTFFIVYSGATKVLVIEQFSENKVMYSSLIRLCCRVSPSQNKGKGGIGEFECWVILKGTVYMNSLSLKTRPWGSGRNTTRWLSLTISWMECTSSISCLRDMASNADHKPYRQVRYWVVCCASNLKGTRDFPTDSYVTISAISESDYQHAALERVIWKPGSSSFCIWAPILWQQGKDERLQWMAYFGCWKGCIRVTCILT